MARALSLGRCIAFVTALDAAISTLPAAAAASDPGPTRFGEGVFTTGDYDFFVALTPDQKTGYFCRASADFGYWTILQTHLGNGHWSPPDMAPFSGRWSDADPHLTPDGSRLFF